ncbi:MAG TPA: type I restriction-modification enzyme R subunit C-terminal domain-containing protein, partial [Candidatus Ozemobacteraceae bacterium]|nr:type I restriction-modification enzyme R subunit C-terminal domain-containing protein [Candidatus Ozemobacteraceae bacterium]
RSIYTLWRQVLEYFDAYLIGLTATPAKHTYGFFEQNLVMSYTHEEAVAEGVNVDFEVYRISTKITEEGGRINRVEDVQIGLRNRQTRKVKWQKPDEDITYTAADLDRAVVAQDQIRKIVQTFRDRVKTEIFPGRKEVPKTLVFAKDDSHAEDIVNIIRQEFAQGDEFCQKITYKTTGKSAKDLIQEFRNRYQPRIAVTVDMIATGTDIKPIEIVIFMRSVKSRVMFEQMKGRGVRTIKPDELQAVTPDSRSKTHFVIIDCIGVTETPLADTHPLERSKSVSFKSLLEHVAMGGTDPEMVSSLAARLARLDKQCGPKEREKIAEAAPGVSLPKICADIVHALDPDRQEEKARETFAIPADQEPTDAQIEAARKALVKEAVKPLATNPKLRTCLEALKTELEQIIDTVTPDEITQAGFAKEAKEKAKSLVQSFEEFLKEHQREIDALQFFYSQPYQRRLRWADIKKLHEAIAAPPRQWTEDKLWAAYELIEQGKVRGARAERRLTDLVSLIRFALHQEQELVPFAERIRERFAAWLKNQESQGRTFTADQHRWLEMIRDHVAQSYEISIEDFGYTPFDREGGLGKAAQIFGMTTLKPLIDELHEALVA